MRILLIVDASLRVPPKEYGGIERVAHTYIEEFINLGHSVKLIAGYGSEISQGKIIFHKKASKSFISRLYRKVIFQFLSIGASLNCDVIFNLGRIDYLIGLSMLQKPILNSLHNPLTQKEIRYAEKLLNKRSALHFISKHQKSTIKTILPSYIIYNSLNIELYKPSYSSGEYLVYLGRITENKGVDIAIEVSLKTRKRLIIAGVVPKEDGAKEFFEQKIKPYIDNKQILFIGAINDAEKQKFLANAIALLFPIRWNEPFGMVMIESLACGTPVIASKIASVPEIIEDGVTGLLCDPKDNYIESFVNAVNNINDIDRKVCRRRFTERFNSKLLTNSMLKALEEVNNL